MQIGGFVNQQNAGWNLVQDVQPRLESQIPRTGMVACADCTLDDGIHIGTDDYPVLGRRLAHLACHDLFPDKSNCATVRALCLRASMAQPSTNSTKRTEG